MYVLDSHKIAFIAHPRTASNSIAARLLELGARKVGSHHSVSDFDERYHGFCVVRNHFDLIRSFYLRYEAPMSFRRYIHEVIFKGGYERPYAHQAPLFAKNQLFPNIRMCRYILHYETLARDWEMFCKIKRLPPEPLAWLNEATSVKNAVYTAELVSDVLERYHEEMESLGYLEDAGSL